MDENIFIPDPICVINCDVSDLNSRQETYLAALQYAYGDNFDMEDGCILAARNEDVDELNEYALNRFSGIAEEIFSADSAIEGQEQLFPVEFLNTLKPNGFPHHKLRLKVCVKLFVNKFLIFK